MRGGRAFRALTAGGAADLVAAAGGIALTVVGARLVAAAADATAQLVDGEGTVLADLSAKAGTSDSLQVPVIAIGKVRVAAISGTGAILNVYVE